MKSNIINRCSSIMGTKSIFVGKMYVLHPVKNRNGSNSNRPKQNLDLRFNNMLWHRHYQTVYEYGLNENIFNPYVSYEHEYNHLLSSKGTVKHYQILNPIENNARLTGFHPSSSIFQNLLQNL